MLRRVNATVIKENINRPCEQFERKKKHFVVPRQVVKYFLMSQQESGVRSPT